VYQGTKLIKSSRINRGYGFNHVEIESAAGGKYTVKVLLNHGSDDLNHYTVRVVTNHQLTISGPYG